MIPPFFYWKFFYPIHRLRKTRAIFASKIWKANTTEFFRKDICCSWLLKKYLKWEISVKNNRETRFLIQVIGIFYSLPLRLISPQGYERLYSIYLAMYIHTYLYMYVSMPLSIYICVYVVFVFVYGVFKKVKCMLQWQ